MLYSTCSSSINRSETILKYSFKNKGIELISLHNIIKNRPVTSSELTYFHTSEQPIICYSYNKPIRNTILNFNYLVSDLDIQAESKSTCRHLQRGIQNCQRKYVLGPADKAAKSVVIIGRLYCIYKARAKRY